MSIGNLLATLDDKWSKIIDFVEFCKKEEIHISPFFINL